MKYSDYDYDRREYNRGYDRDLKREVIDNYGGACACCGEDIVQFLTIDHIFGEGTEHRAEIRKSGSIYRWLKRGFYMRVGFRVLCGHCNGAYSRFHECPHRPGKGMLDVFPRVLCYYNELTDSGARSLPRRVDLTTEEWDKIASIIIQCGYNFIEHLEAEGDGRHYAICTSCDPSIGIVRIAL